jgi:hypothetical protein
MSDHPEDRPWTDLWIRLLESSAPPCPTAVPDPALLGEAQRPECRIWSIVGGMDANSGCAPGVQASPQLPSDPDRALREICQTAPGPLLAHGDRDTIETWTEGELCSIHALMRVAARDGWWRDRLQAAVDWHLEWTQPDNATNRPWGIHAFLALGGLEGRMYAETMLHNAQAGGAQGDPLVAWALGDAARWLRGGIPFPR